MRWGLAVVGIALPITMLSSTRARALIIRGFLSMRTRTVSSYAEYLSNSTKRLLLRSDRLSRCLWSSSRSIDSRALRSVRFWFYWSRFLIPLVASSIWPSLALREFSAWDSPLAKSLFLRSYIWVAFWKWAASLLFLSLMECRVAMSFCRFFRAFSS